MEYYFIRVIIILFILNVENDHGYKFDFLNTKKWIRQT